MVRPLTVFVDRDEIKSLFEALDLWDKIKSSQFNITPSTTKPSPSSHWPAGRSIYLKHHNALGLHVCTTHQVIDRDGHVVHWDETDVLVGEVRISKRSSYNPPANAASR